MKKKILINIIIIIFIILIIFIISKNNISQDTSVLVESSFKNSAWSYTYTGTVICNNGDIYTFNLEKDSQVSPSSDDFINSQYVQKAENVVSPEDLQNMKSHINKLNATYDSRSVGNDMGAQAVYVYRKNNSETEKITLESFGDRVIENTSEDSQILLSLIEKYIPSKNSIYTKLFK